MPSAEANEPSFVVTDRRHFTPSGERRPDVPEEVSTPAEVVEIGAGKAASSAAASASQAAPAKGKSPKGAPQPAAPAPAQPAPGDAEYEEPEPGGPVNFLAFLESLYASAMMQLGAAAPGQLSRPEPDFEGARQTIDILGLLQQKTKGNLNPAEQQALEEILYELRMVYVQLTQKRAR